TLYDLKIAVVTGGQQRWPPVLPCDTTRPQRPVLCAIEFMSFFFLRHVGKSLSSFWRQGRDSSLRSDNQRGSTVPCNRRLEPIEPELRVIVMNILWSCTWYA